MKRRDYRNMINQIAKYAVTGKGLSPTDAQKANPRIMKDAGWAAYAYALRNPHLIKQTHQIKQEALQ